MKEKLFYSMLSMIIVALAILIRITEANAEINPECPNGCLANGDGCYCYRHYDDLREKDWGNTNLTVMKD